ncbi:MAG: hypothetical protein HYX92_08230 [Chloroflexi bacterium]|nr:hypothetical protein [Chloroflexota bacterium]
MLAEKLGIRSVSVVTRGFEHLAVRTAEILGVRNPALATYPGVIMTDSEEALRRKVEGTVFPQILEGLSIPLQTVQKAAGPGAADIVFEGTFDEVQEFFTKNLWTDGLPVVPPTIQRVERFLRHTDRLPDEVIGILGPENRAATIWNVAVNGVMAGCRPEYMPLLIAVVEAIADPEYCIHEAGGTPGAEPIIVLNGPIIKELDFNCGAGVMRVGRQANTSVGRFLRLYMRNVPGLRIAPGILDKASIGYTFNVVLAENEDALEELQWEPYSVSRGFQSGENVVTVESIRTITGPIYCAGSKAVDCAEAIGDIMGPTAAFWTYVGLRFRNSHPVLVISPSIAKVLAGDGWTKRHLQDYLYENCQTTAREVNKWLWRAGHTDSSLSKLLGEDPAGEDADRIIPTFYRADQIGIVVSGDPHRNQARAYIPCHTPPVSKRIAR